ATDADALIARARVMMLIAAVALGALMAWWAWRLAGGVAAVVATICFALDPNFLAHGPLVKNDVFLALVFLALAATVWRMGRRVTVLNALACAALCAAAVNVKFSGLVFGPIVAALLVIRAVLPLPWEFVGRPLQTRAARLSAAAALCVLSLVVSYAGTWAVYRFRFAPSTDPQSHFAVLPILQDIAFFEVQVADPTRTPTPADIDAWRPGATLRAVLYAYSHRLLPESWLAGLLFTYMVSITHENFLAGEFSQRGWWHYFPLAMLVKAPLAHVTAFMAALIIGVTVLSQRILRRSRGGNGGSDTWTLWAAICLIVPPAVFLLLAMASHLNYGLRHVLPVFPFIYIGIGLAAAYAWQRRPRLAAAVAGVLVLGMLVETTAAYPNYIPFFNVAVGGSRGGVKLLGDSNLDWGQDLKLLRDWQRRHPDKVLYLAYYGAADPSYYGIRYRDLRGPARAGGGGGPTTLPSGGEDVIAISATYLQGLYLPPALRERFESLRHDTPTEVLGGSIYLFDRSRSRNGHGND
ncbi:MAG: hypothetical protein QOF78_3125, partial [Phycisphaerales bacterium]|nr:hypothetical protein [Phycisphaerales bacterium]